MGTGLWALLTCVSFWADAEDIIQEVITDTSFGSAAPNQSRYERDS